MKALKFKNNKLFYIDQTKLPLKEVWRQCKSLKQGYKAIKELQVRGAPLIGVFAAYCVCVSLKIFSSKKDLFLKQLLSSLRYLEAARPTAVNLSWALERIKRVVLINKEKGLTQLKQAIITEAKNIHSQDVSLCDNMAYYGAKLIRKGEGVLTHCNAGFLATAGEGTALAAITRACKTRGHIMVYVDETRPLLQGARLTTWELMKNKVPATLICDNMAAYLMQKKKIHKVFVGADRIAANGDTANKIGTYNLAILAKYHKIPFYVVAPFSTFDLKISSGRQIPIEQRDGDEIRVLLGKLRIASADTKVFNPAFDVTPHEFITAIVSDKGIIKPPYRKNIKRVLQGAR